jgi:hypothetical protein|nr:MAG TPA: hypothetical protein [Caudoviricetes sp.]
MKLEEVTQAAEQGAVILHTHMGITSRCRISGVITRYTEKSGWTYSLELTDVNTPSVIIAALEDCEVERNLSEGYLDA